MEKGLKHTGQQVGTNIQDTGQQVGTNIQGVISFL